MTLGPQPLCFILGCRERPSQSINSKGVRYIKGPNVPEEVLRTLLHEGQPFVITNVSSELKLDWTPTAFAQRNDGDNVYVNIETCDSSRQTIKVTLAQYLRHLETGNPIPGVDSSSVRLRVCGCTLLVSFAINLTISVQTGLSDRLPLQGSVPGRAPRLSICPSCTSNHPYQWFTEPHRALCAPLDPS